MLSFRLVGDWWSHSSVSCRKQWRTMLGSHSLSSQLLARDRIIQDDNLDIRAHTLHYYYYVTQQKHPAPGTQYLSTYCNPTVHFIFFYTYLLISYWDKSDRTAGAGRGVVFHHQLILIENIFWKLKSGICLPISTEFCTESQTVNYFYSLFLCPPCSS